MGRNLTLAKQIYAYHYISAALGKAGSSYCKETPLEAVRTVYLVYILHAIGI